MIKFIRMVISSVLTIMFVLLLGVFIVPRIFGYQPYMVVSASMAQVYPVGSLIFVKDAQPEDIEVGDPITFETNSLVITHRVVAIDEENREFTTKGDNNNVSEVIGFDTLRGKASDFSIPMLGYFSAWFTAMQGKLITITIMVCLALLHVVLGKLDEADEEENIGKEE